MMKFLQDAYQVYERLADDVSREIFKMSLLFNATHERKYLNGIIATKPERRPRRLTMDDLLYHLASDICTDSIFYHAYPDMPTCDMNNIIIYGAGRLGRRVHNTLRSLRGNVTAFADTSPKIDVIDGIPVISKKQLLQTYQNQAIFISPIGFFNEIYNDLILAGIPKNNLYVPYDTNDGYFGEPFLKPVQDEVFVDVGAFDGDTIEAFIKFAKSEGGYSKIYGVEADPDNYNALCHNVKGMKNVHIENVAAGNNNTDILKFNANTSSASRISANGNIEIKTTTIDLLVGTDKVTLIKIDTEGFEKNVIEGSVDTIIKNHPRLIISAYHRPEEIVTLPMQIMNIDSSYTFYLRSYNYYPRYSDTILYAV